MNKFIVITSIFQPSSAVKEFAKRNDWQIIVIGDKKSPSDWHWNGVEFLSVSDQKKLGYGLLGDLPVNHYSRKMIGYLYAMQKGADYIADLDDDNVPLQKWGVLPDNPVNDTIYGTGFFNIYKEFTNELIWPRGFPLDKIKSNQVFETKKSNLRVGVWQFLANGDPDVDAIYRLVLLENRIVFADRSPIVLSKKVFCPFNSQNTLFIKEAFPLLYLPAFVTFRYTDILRGLLAQPILWINDLHLGFGSATVYQDRNPHNYLADFESEIPVYTSAEKAAYIALETAKPDRSIFDNLLAVYRQLAIHNIVISRELALAKAWCEDVQDILGKDFGK